MGFIGVYDTLLDVGFLDLRDTLWEPVSLFECGTLVNRGFLILSDTLFDPGVLISVGTVKADGLL